MLDDQVGRIIENNWPVEYEMHADEKIGRVSAAHHTAAAHRRRTPPVSEQRLKPTARLSEPGLPAVGLLFEFLILVNICPNRGPGYEGVLWAVLSKMIDE